MPSIIKDRGHAYCSRRFRTLKGIYNMAKINRDTHEVRELVIDAINGISQPYPKNVTFLVCQKIQNSPTLFQRYNHLSSILTDWVVNNWLGKYTSEVTGLKSNGRHVKVTDLFIKSYSELG